MLAFANGCGCQMLSHVGLREVQVLMKYVIEVVAIGSETFNRSLLSSIWCASNSCEYTVVTVPDEVPYVIIFWTKASGSLQASNTPI